MNYYEWLKTISVGCEWKGIYRPSFGPPLIINYRVTGETKTLWKILIDGDEARARKDNGSIIGSSPYSIQMAKSESEIQDALESQFVHSAVRRLSGLNWERFSAEKLRRVLNVLEDRQSEPNP